MQILARPGPDDLHFSGLVGSARPLGAPFLFLAEATERLFELRVGVGRFVQALQVSFGNQQGTRRTPTAGRDQAETWHTFPFPTPLVGISGSSGWYLDSLQLYYADGSAAARVGGPGGDSAFQLLLHRRQQLWQGTVVGLWGYADDQGIESLGLVFWSVERTVNTEGKNTEGIEA